MQKLARTTKKLIVYMAKKSAGLEANTACTFLNYQPKEPMSVKKLRKF